MVLKVSLRGENVCGEAQVYKELKRGIIFFFFFYYS